jgi:hypothetical protein
MAPDVAASVVGQLLGPEAGAAAAAAGPAGCDGVAAFQRGFRETLARVLRIRVRRRQAAHGAGWVMGQKSNVAASQRGRRPGWVAGE